MSTQATGAVRAVKTVRRSPDSTDEPVGDLDVLNELSSYPTPETPLESSNKLERSATSQELLAPGRAPLRRAATLLGTLRPGAAKTSIALSGGGALAEPESPTQAAEYYLRQSHIDMDSQLRREIEILSNMHHPHIVELLAVFDDKANDVVHIVMPMCAGGELFDRITKDRTQVKTVDAAVYAQQMLSSIEYLHAQAIVHRDLKPENFMFLTPEEDSDLVLIDFGISTFFHRNKPLNAAIGTVYYTAPEVLDGEYDERCDVWSVGVIVYLIIAGHVPFDDPRKRDNEMRIMKQIRTKEPLYEDSIWNYRGRALEFVQRLLQKNPQQRPSSAKALEDAWFKVEHVTQLAAHAPEIVKQLEAFAKMNAMQRVAHQLLASELTESEIGHLKQQFRLLDADGDGILTAQELQKAIFEIEGELLEDKLNVEITCDFDVEAFIAATCRRPNEGVDPEAMRRAFEAFDRNNDGVLTNDDLVDVLGNENDAKQVLDEVGASSISMEQFERMVNGKECGDTSRDLTDRDEKEHLTAKGRVKRHANKETLKDVEHMLYNQPLLQPKAKSPTNEGVSPRNHFAPDPSPRNQWGRSPRSSASTSPMFSTQQTHFAPAADPRRTPSRRWGCWRRHHC